MMMLSDLHEDNTTGRRKYGDEMTTKHILRRRYNRHTWRQGRNNT